LAYQEWVIAGTTPIPAGELRLTALDATITVPAGRRLKITAFICAAMGATNEIKLYRGDLQLNRSHFSSTAPGISSHTFSVVDTPAAGTHTYNVRTWAATAGTLYNDGLNESYLLVEDITYNAPAVADPSVPVGVLARAEQPSSLTGLTTALTDITGLSVNVVVPAGRTIRIRGTVIALQGTAVENKASVYIMEGTTRLGFAEEALNPTVGTSSTVHPETIISPTAGSHTYKLAGQFAAGSGNQFYRDPTNGQVCYITVEDITPTPHAASTSPSSTLAYAQTITNSASLTAEAAIPGLTATVTVAAGRRLRIVADLQMNGSVAGNRAKVHLKRQADGAYLQEREVYMAQANVANPLHIEYIISPTAGTHTFFLTGMLAAGTGNVWQSAAASEPSFLLVEDITGSGIAGHTHTQLDDSGWLDLTPLLQNGWVSYDNTYGPPRYRKKNGVVYLQGLVRSGALGSVICTLPVGFRHSGNPPKLLFATISNPNTAARIDVDWMGQVIQAWGGDNGWTSLSPVMYPVD